MDAAFPLDSSRTVIRLNLRLTPLRLATALTLAGLALRLLDLGSRPLWLDEAFSAWFSDRSFHYLWHVLPTYEAHPPFYYSVLRSWRLLVGPDYARMRGLSVVLGTLTIPVVMGIVFEQERQAPTGRPMLRAAIGGFLTACSPMFMVISQEARPYPLLTLAYSVAILSLLRLVRELECGGPGRWRSWLLLGASTTLTGWSHALGILYAVSIALALLPVWLTARLTRARMVRAATTAVFFAVIYLPCLIMMNNRVEDWSTNWLRWDPGMFLPELLALYTVPVEALSVASAIAALVMVLLFKRALSSTWASTGWNCDRLMLLLWLGPPMLAALISALVEPVFLARTLSGTLVPAYLMIAGAIARTRDGRERRLIVSALCISLFPAALAMATRPPTERWDLLSTYLARNVAARDQIWLYPADSALPLGAVRPTIRGAMRAIPEPFPTLGFNGPVRAGWRGVVSVSAQQASQFAADPAVKNVPVIWLVTRQSSIFDPSNDLPAALARVRRPGRLAQWGYIAARPYYRR
ncbi:MAG TPA: glycosyltransferase family 39 protein [Sphingomicrobium sp.]|nr:glycosyltransferase family 39 protein [Sphingomicrobium sp.]